MIEESELSFLVKFVVIVLLPGGVLQSGGRGRGRRFEVDDTLHDYDDFELDHDGKVCRTGQKIFDLFQLYVCNLT